MTESELKEELENTSEAIERALELYAAHPLASLETYKYFNQKGADAAASRAMFVERMLLGEHPAAPDFEYPDIDPVQLAEYRAQLADMLAELLQDGELSGVGKVVRENITNRLHEVGIMLLTKMQSELEPTDPRYELVSFQLGQNMKEVYGSPEPEHFKGILGYRLSKLKTIESMSEVSEDVITEWQFIKDSLPQDLPIVKPYEPNPETMQWYKEQLNVRIAEAVKAVDQAVADGEVRLNADGKLVGEEIVKATRIALKARGADTWNSELTDEANIDTTQSLQTIFIPSNRTMSIEEFTSVIQSHEIDEHVARRVNGDACGVKALGGTGANGYLAWEEGNGKANEALIKGKITSETSAFAFYLSCGLALGLEGDKGVGRNFGETAELVWRMNFIDDYLKGKHQGLQSDKKAYIEKAAVHLTRIFRGTDGRVPGVVFTKDGMTYYLGVATVFKKWDADMELDEAERNHEHALERVAKIDPTRKDHRSLVQTLV